MATRKDLCPQIAQAQELLVQFRALLQEPDCARLDAWLERCEQSGVSEVAGFAQGLRRDYAAVKAACGAIWSQGSAEGQVNHRKTLKRQMDWSGQFRAAALPGPSPICIPS